MRHLPQAVLVLSFCLCAAQCAYSQDATISSGCLAIQNAPDAPNSALSSFPNEALLANEVVSASVSPVSATGSNLEVDADLKDSTTLPGTLSWVVPADGTYTIVFDAIPSGGAYYDFDCTAAPAPPEPPEPPEPPAGGGGTPAASIPAMPWYGLMFTALGLAGLVARKLRR